jgi:hypothetical protein
MVDALSARLLSLVADHPRLLPHLSEEVLDSLENPVLSELLRQAREEPGGGATCSVEKLIELTPEELRPQVAAAALSGEFLHSEHPEQTLAQLSRNIRASAIQREVHDLTQHLKRVQKLGDATAIQNICQRIQELTLFRKQLLATNRETENLHASTDPAAQRESVHEQPDV